jgi:separase
MGCSSGRLLAVGEYDPLGTVVNYLMHSPCVVGNLWDVTDKDIDRFALSALGKWGLFPNIEFKSKNPDERIEEEVPRDIAPAKLLQFSGDHARNSLFAFQSQPQHSGGTVRSGTHGISESISTARSDCHFPYLIGAAPVMYGIPISLS